MNSKDKKELYRKSDMRDEEMVKDSIIGSFWKLFRFLFTELIPIGYTNEYMVGSLILKDRENDFARVLLDKALRIDSNRIIVS